MKKLENMFFSMSHDFLEVYIPQNRGSGNHTKESYKDGLGTFWDYVRNKLQLNIRKFKFSDCTFDLVLDYRNWMYDSKGYAASTANHRLAVLRAYLHYAAARDVGLQQIDNAVSQVPLLSTPKDILPIIENRDSIKALLSSPKNTHTGRRDRMLMSIIFDTGGRVSEVTGMKLRDVVYNASVPYVQFHGKGKKERVVSLADETVKLIRSYVEEFHPEMDMERYFFYTVIKGTAGRMSERNVQRILHKHGLEAGGRDPGIPQNVSPHMLRRTRASLLYQDGTDPLLIADRLGHSSVQTTMDHYAKASNEQKRESMNNLHGYLPVEEQKWPEDLEELKRLCGL